MFQEFIVKLDDESSTVTNYTGGEGAGSSWTDKVMSFKGQQETAQEEGDGAGDDEWVGLKTKYKCVNFINDLLMEQEADWMCLVLFGLYSLVLKFIHNSSSLNCRKKVLVIPC